MKKAAFLFPGQGSQKVGMGRDVYETQAEAREVFEMAEAITGMDIKRLCFEGPMEMLTRTVHLQPAMTAVNLALFKVLEKAGCLPGAVAGHSLGEYSALHASGAVSLQDAFNLVLKRGELMHREATLHAGVMHALVGLRIQDVERIVAEEKKSGIVDIANHNTGTQIVITGEPVPVERVSNRAKAAGARAIPLKVSGAWHSELIRGSVKDFQQFLSGIDFSPPEIPLLLNVTAGFRSDPVDLRDIMSRQLCNRVRWYESVQALMERAVELFVEVGPGNVLCGLLKKIIPEDYPCEIVSANSMKGIESVLGKTG